MIKTIINSKKDNKLRIIAFDADDTLWDNEPYFRTAENKFYQLFKNFGNETEITDLLLKKELKNIGISGYGSKSFTLSLLEVAIELTNHKVTCNQMERIMDIGKEILQHPIALLDGVEEVLSQLKEHYTLVMATKGDLMEQRKKLERSGLAPYFDHIEIMIEKDVKNYQRLLHILKVKPEEFLMIGNSPKSDILPVIEIGGHAVQIPYHTLWEHEKTDKKLDSNAFVLAKSIRDIPLMLE